jgi:hypothetical protein
MVSFKEAPDPCPTEFVALIMYSVSALAAVGVPVMAQVVAFNWSGEGSTGVEEQEVMAAPLLATAGVIERALPTVPDTELGLKLTAGVPRFTVMVTCAVDDPEALVAVTV